MANLAKKSFSLIDPFGTTKESQNYYFQKFVHFLIFYNKNVECLNVDLINSNWKMVNPNHYIQKDSHNCGVLVIEFAENIMRNMSITEDNI